MAMGTLRIMAILIFLEKNLSLPTENQAFPRETSNFRLEIQGFSKGDLAFPLKNQGWKQGFPEENQALRFPIGKFKVFLRKYKFFHYKFKVFRRKPDNLTKHHKFSIKSQVSPQRFS